VLRGRQQRSILFRDERVQRVGSDARPSMRLAARGSAGRSALPTACRDERAILSVRTVSQVERPGRHYDVHVRKSSALDRGKPPTQRQAFLQPGGDVLVEPGHPSSLKREAMVAYTGNHLGACPKLCRLRCHLLAARRAAHPSRPCVEH